jgi:undecaprenyl-diphosphatase
MTAAVDFFLQSDHDLFLLLNGVHTHWLDVVMYWVTFKFTWIPLYMLLLAVTIRTEHKRSIAIIVTVIAAVVLADKITSGLMKPYFMRLRPCHDPSFTGLIHEVGNCGGLFGFASSHASTSFAVAVTWFLLLREKVRHMGWLLLWAALYAYSRVYVGVHYPGDILVGALIGSCVGVIFVKLHNTFIKKYYHN